MDKNLLRDIQVEIDKIKDCDFLSDEEGTKLILKLVELFSFDIRKRFLWDNKSYGRKYDYNNSPDDWEPILQGLLAGFNGLIFMVVSNEDFFPWKVLHIKKEACANLLSELPYFEYFIFNDSMKTVVFETHHKSFIVFERD